MNVACTDATRCGQPVGRGHPRHGWVRVQVAGTSDPARWYCGRLCATRALSIGGGSVDPLDDEVILTKRTLRRWLVTVRGIGSSPYDRTHQRRLADELEALLRPPIHAMPSLTAAAISEGSRGADDWRVDT